MEQSTRQDDLITIGLVTWTTIGLFVDAYFHSTDPGLETFWTPWHALFYSGFTATALWLIRITATRLARVPPTDDPVADGLASHTRSLLAAAPLGYRPALIGLVIFAIGGLGDAVWHTVFGVETSLDALISPTHLLLGVGLVLIASAPGRAAWHDTSDSTVSSWSTFLAPFLSILWTTTIVAFFLKYGFLLTDIDLGTVPFDPTTGQGEFAAAYGLLATIVTSVILMTPVLIALKRWRRLPVGTVALLFGLVTTLLGFGFDDDLEAIPAAFAAGLFADVAWRFVRRSTFAATVPAVLWSLYLISAAVLGDGVAWPPEIWGGIIVFGALTGLGVNALLDLDAPLDASPPNRRAVDRNDSGLTTTGG